MSDWWETLDGWWKTAAGLGTAGVLTLVGLAVALAARPDDEIIRILRNLMIGAFALAVVAGGVALLEEDDAAGVLEVSPTTAVSPPPAAGTTTSVAVAVASPASPPAATQSPVTPGAVALAPVQGEEAEQVIDDFVSYADALGSEPNAWAMLHPTLQEGYARPPRSGQDVFTDFWQLVVEHVELDSVSDIGAGKFAADAVYEIYVDGNAQGPTCRQRQLDTYGLARQPDGRVLITSYAYEITESC